ncbi:MAG: Rieske (2Fe-2S) protein [Candidatus Nanopelagicales bacterium]
MSGCDCNCGSAKQGVEDPVVTSGITPAVDEPGALRPTMRSERGAVSRRGVLAGSAAAVAVLALAACTSSDEAGSTTGGTTPQGSPDAPDTGSASQSPAGTEPIGDPIAGTSDFPVGGGAVLKAGPGVVVITHPTDSEFLAFNGRCPHAGCPVTEVVENTIRCNCHGSTFDGSTGQRLEGPAPTGLEPVPVVVEGGEIFLT